MIYRGKFKYIDLDLGVIKWLDKTLMLTGLGPWRDTHQQGIHRGVVDVVVVSEHIEVEGRSDKSAWARPVAAVGGDQTLAYPRGDQLVHRAETTAFRGWGQ